MATAHSPTAPLPPSIAPIVNACCTTFLVLLHSFPPSINTKLSFPSVLRPCRTTKLEKSRDGVCRNTNLTCSAFNTEAQTFNPGPQREVMPLGVAEERNRV
eukprot:scaffold37781_cov300-Skeletonema_dohrnii-CCMP3373.AAC.3